MQMGLDATLGFKCSLIILSLLVKRVDRNSITSNISAGCIMTIRERGSWGRGAHAVGGANRVQSDICNWLKAKSRRVEGGGFLGNAVFLCEVKEQEFTFTRG